MPNAYVVTDHGRVVLERWAGTVSHAELLAHERAQMQDPAIRPGAVMLVDAIQAHFETPLEAVHELSDLYRSRDNLRVVKCALLVNSETFERAQLFAAQAGKLGITVIVFSLIDTACLWLGIDRDQALAQLRRLKV